MGAEWLAPVLDVVGDIAGNIVNWFSTEKTNDTNKNIHQSDQDFQAAQTQAAWERDDTAHQREVADLEAAGLSPLANTTGSQVTSPLGSASPIAAQAPQVSFSSLANSVLQAQQLKENKRHNLAQEGFTQIELQQTAEEIRQKAQQLSLENKKIENDFVYNSKYLDQLANQLNESKRHNKAEEAQKKTEYLAEQFWKEIEKQTGGKFNYKSYYDIDEYETALNAWSTEYLKFIDTLGTTSSSESTGKSNTYAGDVSAGNELFKGSVGGTYADSKSSSSSENISQKQQAMIDHWYATHPMPVFHYYKKED